MGLVYLSIFQGRLLWGLWRTGVSISSRLRKPYSSDLREMATSNQSFSGLSSSKEYFCRNSFVSRVQQKEKRLMVNVGFLRQRAAYLYGKLTLSCSSCVIAATIPTRSCRAVRMRAMVSRRISTSLSMMSRSACSCSALRCASMRVNR